MKIKDFIFWSPSKIKGITPIKTTTNKYGVEVYFYLINSANLNTLRQNTFILDFKENKDEDFKWFLNRWAVSVVNKPYLLNKFIQKDNYTILNRENWTKTNVILN
jgi:hypothetical protein